MKVTAPVRIDISAGWSDADPFRREFGGAVLNAALNLRVSGTLKGKALTTSLDKVPSNSGLGTSGALRTVYLVAANPHLIRNKVELIKRVNTFENAIIGQRAGFQDQAAAIFGGVNYWEFRHNGDIYRMSISQKKAQHLYDRLVLVYTGDRHLSSSVHQKVFENPKHFMKSIPAIAKMRDIAKKMAFHVDNEEVMAQLIRETWELQKSLSNTMETDTMRRLQRVCTDCYLAARATGAGGGGCMIFYVKPEKKKHLIFLFNQMKKKLPNMKVLPFEFDYKGIELDGN